MFKNSIQVKFLIQCTLATQDRCQDMTKGLAYPTKLYLDVEENVSNFVGIYLKKKWYNMEIFLPSILIHVPSYRACLERIQYKYFQMSKIMQLIKIVQNNCSDNVFADSKKEMDPLFLEQQKQIAEILDRKSRNYPSNLDDNP